MPHELGLLAGARSSGLMRGLSDEGYGTSLAWRASMNAEDRILWTTLCAPLDDGRPPSVRWNRLSSQVRNALDALFEKLRPELDLLGMNTTWSRDDVLRLLGIETQRRSAWAIAPPSGPRWEASDTTEPVLEDRAG